MDYLIVHRSSLDNQTTILLLPNLFQNVIAVPVLVVGYLEYFSKECDNEEVHFCIRNQEETIHLSSIYQRLPMDYL